ncbi:MAG TPA: DUF6624 domain-containing protein [Pirellulales bacterium]|nr:DUF6624 domain-containing protein [Pirellulales bacterium]
MKLQGVLVAAVLLVVVGRMAGQEQPAETEPKPAQDEKLRQELLSRVEKDQAARKAMMELMRRSKEIDPNHPDIKKLLEIDRQNTAWLKEIVEEHGWPGKTLVGEDGAHSAWLLVQHADHDVVFQKKSLDLLRAAVEEEEASPQDFAYLTDRVRVAEKKKQLYGTQFVQEGGKLVPQPIEDEEHVDDRRKEIGLEPLAEYLKFAEEYYMPQEDEKGE